MQPDGVRPTGRPDGVQADASFHQHGSQLYSGWGYGAMFTTTLLVLEAWAQDAPEIQLSGA